MRQVIRQKDFWAGLLFVSLGAFLLIKGSDYPMGTMRRMGPGYFPAMIGWILVGLGVAQAAWTFVVRGEFLEGPFKPRSVILVLLAVVTFAYLIDRAGLIVSVLAVVFIGSMASHEHRTRDALILAGVLAIGAALIFILGLGVPMKVWPV